MKAFGVAVVFALLLALASGAVMESLLSREADRTFATSSTRIGEEPSIEHRNFSGQNR